MATATLSGSGGVTTRRTSLGADVLLSFSPDLHNASRYTKVTDVPIYDVHKRARRKADGSVVEDYVGPEQLDRVAKNTQSRIDEGEYPLVLIGHTDDDGPEADQPPLAGFVGGVRVGDYRGRKMIYADLYIRNDRAEAAAEFPRRSVEIVRKLEPDGFIDALALLKRMPERPLGILTMNRSGGDVERYEFDDVSEPGPEVGGDPMPLDAPAAPGGLTEEQIEKIAHMTAAATAKAIGELFEKMASTPVDEPLPGGDEFDDLPPEDGLGGEGDIPGDDLGGLPPEGGDDGLPFGGEETPAEEEAEDEDVPTEPYRRAANSIQLDRYRRDLKARDERIGKLEKQLRDLAFEATKKDRAVILTGLVAEHYEIDDLADEVERCAAMTEREFEGRVADIRKNFRRTPLGETPVRTPDTGRRTAEAPAAGGLSEDDYPELIRYAAENRIRSPQDAVVAFLAAKAAKQAAKD